MGYRNINIGRGDNNGSISLFRPGSSSSVLRNTRQELKKKEMMFHEHARDYIMRLISLQRHIPKQYKRIDQVTVIQSMDTLETYLAFYPYNSDQKMRTFWRKHRYRIKILLPRKEHCANTKLLVEFELLDAFASADQENAIWHTVATALSKF